MQHQTFEPIGMEIATRARSWAVIANPATSSKGSEYLPVGAQGKLIDAAVIASHRATPINRLLTVNSFALANSDMASRFGRGSLANDTKDFMELFRHWLASRKIPVTYIWAREFGRVTGEHLHIGFHLPDEFGVAFVTQCARWFLAAPTTKRTARDVIAEAASGDWQLKKCLRNDRSGGQIAAYLGKDEPEVIVSAWGTAKPNLRKRDVSKPPTPGLVVGFPSHAYRFGISRSIAPTSPAGQRIIGLASDAERLICNAPY